MRWKAGPHPSRSWTTCVACSINTRRRANDRDLARNVACPGMDAIAFRLAGRGTRGVTCRCADGEPERERAICAWDRHADPDDGCARCHIRLAESHAVPNGDGRDAGG